MRSLVLLVIALETAGTLALRAQAPMAEARFSRNGNVALDTRAAQHQPRRQQWAHATRLTDPMASRAESAPANAEPPLSAASQSALVGLGLFALWLLTRCQGEARSDTMPY